MLTQILNYTWETYSVSKDIIVSFTMLLFDYESKIHILDIDIAMTNMFSV